MNCYQCAKEGKKMEAVAVCTVCGMAVCMGHAHEREVQVTQRVSGWGSKTAMQVLCERCSKLAISA